MVISNEIQSLIHRRVKIIKIMMANISGFGYNDWKTFQRLNMISRDFDTYKWK